MILIDQYKSIADTIVQWFTPRSCDVIALFRARPASRTGLEDNGVSSSQEMQCQTKQQSRLTHGLHRRILLMSFQTRYHSMCPMAPRSLDRAQAVVQATVTEAKKRSWKMNVAAADSGGNLVAFQRMDGAMLASIKIAKHKARAAATFRRPTKVFEDGIKAMHLNYLLAADGVIASRGGIPVIDQDLNIGAISVSGGTDSQDEVVSKAVAGGD